MKMKFNLGKTLARVTKKPGLVIRKHSPEILMATGVISIIGATILACRATLKVDGIMEKHESEMEKIAIYKEKVETGEIDGREYTAKDQQVDTVIVYKNTSLDFVKAYAPAVLLGIMGFACILGAHNILKKRNVALTAALNTVSTAFSNYRKRVVEEHGEEADYMYKNNIRKTQVTEEIIDEKGKKKTVTKDKYEIDGSTNGFAKWFDETSLQWSKLPGYNTMFVQGQERYWNQRLRTDGYVFLNDVWESLGVDKDRTGQIYGWLYEKNNGDDYIDFGINKMNDIDFLNGNERNILIDPNVDGPILDMI